MMWNFQVISAGGVPNGYVSLLITKTCIRIIKEKYNATKRLKKPFTVDKTTVCGFKWIE